MSETIPCKTCGKPTAFPGTKLCYECWNAERLLPDYLKSPGGVKFVRSLMPTLDDWVDGKPDAWDYEAVLVAHDAKVVECKPVDHGWSLGWRHGSMHIGAGSEIHAKKAAALFIEIWLRGVAASFADKIVTGFILWLEWSERPERP